MSGHPGPIPRGGKADTTPTRIVLKKGGTFFLNGALIRAHDAFGAEIHLAEALLLPSQILSPRRRARRCSGSITACSRP